MLAVCPRLPSQPAVLPEKEDTYREGLVAADWATSYLKAHLVAISKQEPLTQTPFREKPGLPALRPGRLSQPSGRNSWDCVSTNRPEAFPDQVEMLSHLLLSILIDQSGQLHSDQSGHCFLDQLNREDSKSSFASDQAIQGPGSGCVSHLLSGPRGVLSLFT